MVGMHIMDMMDSLDDILKFREVKGIKLDDIMKRKVNAFALLLANSVLPQRKDTHFEKFVRTNVAQQTFKSIAAKHEDIKNKEVRRTLSECKKEEEERLKLTKEKDYTDDTVLEQAIQELYGNKLKETIEVTPEPVKKAIDINAELKKSLKAIKEEKPKKAKEEKPKETIAKTIVEEKHYTFDQQYLIDLYVKNFGKNKVSRDKFKQQVKTNRYVKLFGTYTDYVNAVLS